jgi:hypothetical protein
MFFFLQSVSFHEGGWRHKNNVERRIREARRDVVRDERDQSRLQRQMAAIEHVRSACYILFFIKTIMVRLRSRTHKRT